MLMHQYHAAKIISVENDYTEKHKNEKRIIVQFMITLLLAALVPDISKAHPVVKCIF